jgi:hypothetical protein
VEAPPAPIGSLFTHKLSNPRTLVQPTLALHDLRIPDWSSKYTSQKAKAEDGVKVLCEDTFSHLFDAC